MKLVPLKKVARIARETVNPQEMSDVCPYVGLEHITNDGEFLNVPSSGDSEPKSTKFRFDSRHILYGKLRPYLRKIARPSFSGICSTDILPILVGENLDRDFLYHFLRTPQMVQLATQRCNGANLPRLSPKQFEDFEIPLFPLSEQKRIAAILDKADGIRRKREKAIELTESFLRSVFLEMFGDPVANTKNWKMVRLEDVFNQDRSGTCCGPFGSALKKHEYVQDGIPVWGIDNVRQNFFVERGSFFITPEKYEQLKRYNAQEGDILISRAGTVGRMSVCHPSMEKSIIGTNLIRLCLDLIRCCHIFSLLFIHSSQDDFLDCEAVATLMHIHF